MNRPERGPRADTAIARTAGTYLVPVVDEVAALLDAAERVLAACARAEDRWADRAVCLATAVDPCTLQPHAVLGPGMPVPLAGRVARCALERLARTLRRVLPPGPDDHWTIPGRHRVAVPFRALRLDTTDLAILGHAAAQLTLPRRSGAVAGALASLGGADGEPPDDRHPASLGCLLAALVPVVDPASRALHALASGTGGGAVLLDGEALAAHREVGRRLLARMERVR